MGATLINTKAIWGIPSEQKPIKAPFLYERVRFRFRNRDFARAFFKTANGIREFLIEDSCNGFWTVNKETEQGSNQRRFA
jgi:hypothetical protein